MNKHVFLLILAGLMLWVVSNIPPHVWARTWGWILSKFGCKAERMDEYPMLRLVQVFRGFAIMVFLLAIFVAAIQEGAPRAIVSIIICLWCIHGIIWPRVYVNRDAIEEMPADKYLTLLQVQPKEGGPRRAAAGPSMEVRIRRTRIRFILLFALVLGRILYLYV